MDALLKFFDFLKLLKARHRIISYAPVGVEGAFNDVQPNVLDSHLSTANVNPYLRTQSQNFFTDGPIFLRINGHQTGSFQPTH
jgi:hypothetical protein